MTGPTKGLDAMAHDGAGSGSVAPPLSEILLHERKEVIPRDSQTLPPLRASPRSPTAHSPRSPSAQAGFDTTNRVKDVEQRWLDNLPPEAAVPVQADERPADPLHYSGTALKALQTSTTNSYKTATGEDRARGAYEPYQLPQSSCEYGWLSGPQVLVASMFRALVLDPRRAVLVHMYNDWSPWSRRSAKAMAVVAHVLREHRGIRVAKIDLNASCLPLDHVNTWRPCIKLYVSAANVEVEFDEEPSPPRLLDFLSKHSQQPLDLEGYTRQCSAVEQQIDYRCYKNAVRIRSVDHFAEMLVAARNKLVVVFYGASWYSAHQRISLAFSSLTEKHSAVVFLYVQTDVLTTVRPATLIPGDMQASVPYFEFFRKGVVVDSMDGADDVLLQQKIVMLTTNNA